jgi:hypothetical protein
MNLRVAEIGLQVSAHQPNVDRPCLPSVIGGFGAYVQTAHVQMPSMARKLKEPRSCQYDKNLLFKSSIALFAVEIDNQVLECFGQASAHNIGL